MLLIENIIEVEDLDNEKKIHTDYGSRKALQKFFKKISEEIVTNDYCSLLASGRESVQQFAETASELFKTEIMTNIKERIKGMTFILKDDDDGPTVVFPSGLNNDDKVNAAFWLINKLQGPLAIEKIGTIQSFNCNIGGVTLTIHEGESLDNIRNRWVKMYNICSDR